VFLHVSMLHSWREVFEGEDPIASPKHDQEKKEIKNKRKTEHRKKKN